MRYYYDIIPTAVPWGFLFKVNIFVLGQNMMRIDPKFVELTADVLKILL